MTKRHRLFRIGGALLGATLVGVVGVETLARLLMGPPAIHFLTPGRRDVQTDFDVTYGVGRNGTRRTCPPPALPERTVVIVGDSFAFGQGVRDGEDFPARISCRLPRARVVNLGSIGQDFLYYELALRSLVPSDADAIVLLLFEDDFPPDDWDSRYWRVKHAVYGWSHTVLLLRRARHVVASQLHREALASFNYLGKLNNPKSVVATNPAFFVRLAHPPSKRLEMLEWALRRFISDARRDRPSATVFVAVAPEASTVSPGHREFYLSLGRVPLPRFGHPSHLYRRAQATCLAESGCRFIDVFPALALHGTAAYFPHDFHWTARGHEIVAGMVVEAVAGPRR